MDVVENEENEGEMNLGSEQDGGDEILSESEGEEEENKEEFIIDLSPYLQDGDKEKSLLSDDPNQYYKPEYDFFFFFLFYLFLTYFFF